MSFDNAMNAATAANPAPAGTPGSNTNNAGLGKWYGIAQGVSALSTLAGGFSAFSAAQNEAQLQQKQAQILLEESQRDAAQKARDVTTFQSKQAHTYASSGITLEGSPILVLEQTRAQGQEEVDAIVKRGQAEADLANAKAKALRTAGRNSLFGSVLTSGATGLQGYITGRRLGIYGNSKTAQSPLLGDVPDYNDNTDRYG